MRPFTLSEKIPSHSSELLSSTSAEHCFSYANLLEQIEVLRTRLRWAQQLDHTDIQQLLSQCTEIRSELIGLSRQQRLLVNNTVATIAVSPQREDVLNRDFAFDGVFGDSPKLLEVMSIAEKAAPTDLPVLIRGESGTGKELMAKVMHDNSERRDGPLISVNCGAIPENLLESELFGHKKGAFSGAHSDRKGKFESAADGTIFLDEIGELPLTGQVALLRVLQSQEIQRVGSDEPIHVDARIVAATNRDLLAMVHEGTFREDLYYRLSVIELNLPSLRERRDEIPLLIDFFCSEAAEKLNRNPIRISSELQAFLLHYDYPGNIRELQNLIFRLSCLADDIADVKHLPPAIRQSSAAPSQEFSSESLNSKVLTLKEIKQRASDMAEKKFLQTQLHLVGGKVVELAKQQNMNRSYLQTLMKKHGLSALDFRH